MTRTITIHLPTGDLTIDATHFRATGLWDISAADKRRIADALGLEGTPGSEGLGVNGAIGSATYADGLPEGVFSCTFTGRWSISRGELNSDGVMVLGKHRALFNATVYTDYRAKNAAA